MTKAKNTKGLVLAETLLAIAMLSISVVVTASIIQTALKATHLSKNYLIAQNLVTEGIEAVKGIRDTNWLKHPSDSECWLSTTDECSGPTDPHAEVGRSYIAKNNSGLWELDERGINLDFETETEYSLQQFRLNYVGIGTPPIQTFSHVPGDDSPYYRSVKFTHVSSADATFDVKVQWKDGQKVKSIVRSVTIFNYF